MSERDPLYNPFVLLSSATESDTIDEAELSLLLVFQATALKYKSDNDKLHNTC